MSGDQQGPIDCVDHTVKLAVLAEKLEQLIHSHELAHAERKENNRSLQSRFDTMDKRIQNIETVVLTARVSWRIVFRMAGLYVTVSGALIALAYKALYYFGIVK